MGRLTTHVLDTAAGRPAEGLKIDFWRTDGVPVHLGTFHTNADGRVSHPILSGDDFAAGVYELQFHAGDYFRAGPTPLAEPLFLDVIPIRFGVSDSSAHYHVPLLLSPFGYSTYRGS